MKLLVPKPITAARIAAGTTIAEPAAGETLWVSGGTYALGDKRIRVETHRVYEAVQASTGRTIAPELDGTYWKDMGPTLRWAPFDQYINTPATATTTLTYVLKPGFVIVLHCMALMLALYRSQSRPEQVVLHYILKVGRYQSLMQLGMDITSYPG